MGAIFSYFFPKRKLDNPKYKELLKEDESFREYLKVYTGEYSDAKLEFDNDLYFKN
tara:strand:+ start:639 stop:806 length:168 start_codon:yes stop_codon:yes gene_type:complete